MSPRWPVTHLTGVPQAVAASRAEPAVSRGSWSMDRAAGNLPLAVPRRAARPANQRLSPGRATAPARTPPRPSTLHRTVRPRHRTSRSPPGATARHSHQCSRHYPHGGAVTWRPGESSGGRSPAAEVPDEILAGQDGGADAADEEDQHPDGVQVGRDQPERADDQPEQDDHGYRSYVSAAHIPA